MKTQQRPLFFFSLLLTALFSLQQPIPAVGYSIIIPSSADDADFIRTSCNATLYSDLCYSSLSRYATAVQQNPAQLARYAIAVSLSKARRMTTYVSNISRQADYGSDPRAAAAVHDCFTNFGDAVDQIHGSIKQMRQLEGGAGGESLRFQMSNVQTWMSAALTNEDTCTEGFEDVAADCPVKKKVCDRAEKVKKLTSNALALVNSYVAKSTPP